MSEESDFEPLPQWDDTPAEVSTVVNAASDVVYGGGDEHDLAARLVSEHGEAEALRMLSLVEVMRTRAVRDHLNTDPLAARQQIVSLVTENMHRRSLDQSNPIIGEPALEPGAARDYLARIDTESKLIAEAVDGPNGPEDFVGELVAFAATALELWALESKHDPFALLEQIAIQWENAPDAT